MVVAVNVVKIISVGQRQKRYKEVTGVSDMGNATVFIEVETTAVDRKDCNSRIRGRRGKKNAGNGFSQLKNFRNS